MSRSDADRQVGSRRLTELDGLRGIAAVVVLISHCMLTDPALSAAHYGSSADDVHASFTRALTWSPLHAFWNGGAAVRVFFVLSGLVLTRAYLAARWDDWRAYYPQRVLRLYIPAVASLAVAALIYQLPVDGRFPSPWLQEHDRPLSWSELLEAATLIGDPAHVNLPLWSMRWEVLFSLLLPVAVGGINRLQPRLWSPALLLCLVAAALDRQLPYGAGYAALFGLGVLLAPRVEGLRRAGSTLTNATGASWALAVLLLMNAGWIWPSGSHEVTAGLQAAGYAGLVTLFVAWQPARAAGAHSWAQLLGRWSFSLYLVHEPLVVTVAAAAPDMRLVARLLVLIPLCLTAAWAFHTTVEGPAHRASQRLAVRVRRARFRSRDSALAR